MATDRNRIRVLSFHAAYACRHSGACCSAGWRIPIDSARQHALEAAARAGRLPSPAARTDSRGALTVLQLAGDGTCIAFEPRAGTRPPMCAIHRALGPGALPAACRHFPRVCLLDGRGVSVTLSHFCPTAAALLFDDARIELVEAPATFTDLGDLEGLDARDALPPLLAPGMLMDLDAYSAFEAWAFRVLGSDVRHARHPSSPEVALRLLGAGADHCRTWTPRDGTLLDRVEALHQALEDPAWVERTLCEVDLPSPAQSFSEVLACVPPELDRAALPEDLDALDQEFVAAEWQNWTAPLNRYLAARLHASWTAYQGQGLRTLVRSLTAPLAVVRVEAARQCGRAKCRLDRTLLLQAIRQADLMLVHEADPSSLARAWSAGEFRV